MNAPVRASSATWPRRLRRIISIGLTATCSPRLHPETGQRLESFRQDGNIDERRETINIRARTAVILASGGHAGNPEVRSMFYPAMREPAFPTSGAALQGTGGQDGSAMMAGLEVGANLAGISRDTANALGLPAPD